jgi:hypothetical protein
MTATETATAVAIFATVRIETSRSGWLVTIAVDVLVGPGH